VASVTSLFPFLFMFAIAKMKKDLHALTKKELRKLLANLGRSSLGSKDTLLERTISLAADIGLCSVDVTEEAVSGFDEFEREIDLYRFRKDPEIVHEPELQAKGAREKFPGSIAILEDEWNDIAPQITAPAVVFEQELDGDPDMELSFDSDLSDLFEGGTRIVSVVGASACGKTTLLQRLGLAAMEDFDWNESSAIVSQFGSFEEASRRLSAVGLTSIPSWCKPFRILSTGEKFRAKLAKAMQLCEGKNVLVLDDFAATLDRATARTCSASFAREFRRSKIPHCVLTTSVPDILKWLCPEKIVWLTDDGLRVKRYVNESFPKPHIKICSKRWESKFPTPEKGSVVLETRIQVDEFTKSCDRLFDVEFDGFCHLQIPRLELEDEGFTFGSIIGSSGSSKSAILRRYFGSPSKVTWNTSAPALSHFPSHGLHHRLEIVCLQHLQPTARTIDEFSSTERARLNLARLLDFNDVCVDEFTTGMDRKLASQIANNVAKFLRDRSRKRWVFVSCFRDLFNEKPDWKFDTSRGMIFEGPETAEKGMNLTFILQECSKENWELFKHHHYKSEVLSDDAVTFVLLHEESHEPVGFTAAIRQVGNGGYRAHRTVILPSWQGLGIGSRLSDACADSFHKQGHRYFAQTVHPKFGEYRDASLLWAPLEWNHEVREFKIETWRQRLENKLVKLRVPRFVYSHEYVGARDADARAFLEERITYKEFHQ